MKLQFDDGVSFNMEGKLRIERRRDGYYVVGQGMLCPVNSYEEGLELIKELSKGDKLKC